MIGLFIFCISTA